MSEILESKEERTHKDLWVLAEFTEEREDDDNNNPAVSNRFPVTEAAGKRTQEAMAEAARNPISTKLFSSLSVCLICQKHLGFVKKEEELEWRGFIGATERRKDREVSEAEKMLGLRVWQVIEWVFRLLSFWKSLIKWKFWWALFGEFFFRTDVHKGESGRERGGSSNYNAPPSLAPKTKVWTWHFRVGYSVISFKFLSD